MIPFFISHLQISGKKGILHLRDINSKDQADELKSCTLLLPLDLLPKLEDGQFYYHEIIGYEIVDQTKGKLGIVEDVITGGNQDLISMKYKSKEVLIPVNNEIVSHADHKQKKVYVNLPEGLLAIYL